MVLRPKSECFVSGSLALNLRVSSYLGIAPVRFTKRYDGCIVRTSPFMRLYSYVFISVVDILIILSVISNYKSELEHCLCTNSYMKRAVWIADVAAVMLLTNIAVYTAPKKMQRFLKYYGNIKKINEDFNLTRLPKNPEKMRYCYGVAYIFIGIVIYAADFAATVRHGDIKLTTVGSLYSMYFLCYTILQFAQMQFVLITWHALSTFERINLSLSKLLMEKQKTEILNVSNFNTNKNNLMMNNTVPLKSVNNLIDTIGFTKTKSTGYSQSVLVQTSEPIRRLALLYSEICDVVKQIDESFGVILLLMIGSFLMHLVITPYNLIESLSDASNMPQLSELFKNLCLQFAWCVFHSGNLILIVEPCHRTIAEVAKIKKLVSKLMRSSTITHDHDFNELNLFYKILLLNDVCYAPLQVCTLNRALVATVMSSITTYLVILIQM